MSNVDYLTMSAVVPRRRGSANFTRLVTEPAPTLAFEAESTPRGHASSPRRGSRLLPGVSRREWRRLSGRSFYSEQPSVLTEQAKEREVIEDQKGDDVRFKALALSRKFKIEFYEMKTILGELQKILERHASAGMSLKEFSDFLCNVLDVPMVEDRVVQNAYTASRFEHLPIDIEKFLDWYKINMFSEVARIRAGADARTSADLVRALARKFGVHESDVDKAKKAFDKFDVDKSGDIDYCEFTAMMKQLMGGASDAAQLSEARLRIFWKEIDSDSSGTIDFAEFTDFFVKYFLSGSDFGGIAEAFYASHRPDVQLQALFRRNPQDADGEPPPLCILGVDRSRPLAPLQRNHTID
eukprot:TRINITY_DN11350_c0_g2_i1.p1 TRINITY_DN11350_c0_g2~~TRINITY_DN11350_c0_g2_i1.p1  ORF type:complete len:354 (+),score=56.27 TRINITY_DN11350_c0_g2_i1:9-1070(+)